MNNNSNFTGVILGVLIVIAIIGGVIWYQRTSRTDSGATATKNGGTLYIGVTDATADIKNVQEINMEIKKVEIHSGTKGWITVSSDAKKYDLLALHANNKTELYAKQKIDAGTYDRIRVSLGDTTIKTKTKGDVRAYTPSSQVVLNMNVKIESDKDTHVKLDILADKSLHSTSDNKYVFAPVVKANSQSNATVTVSSGNVITSTGGITDSSVSVGVDIDGSSKNNFNLTTDNNLKVDASAVGNVKFMLGGQTYVENRQPQEQSIDTNVNTNLNTNNNINTNLNSGSNSTNTNVDTSTNLDLNGKLDLNLY